MNSGNNGARRHPNDLYRTERRLIRAALHEFCPPQGRLAVPAILDVGAGDGRWGIEARKRFTDAFLVGVESRPEEPRPAMFDRWNRIDFRQWQFRTAYFNLIVSNPPFRIAEEIIRHAWPMLAPGGTMIMLLPLNFSASLGRYDGRPTKGRRMAYKRGLFDELAPVEKSTVVRRPSFYGGGSAKGAEYGVFVWMKSQGGENLGTPRRWVESLLYHKRGTDAGQDVRPGAVEQLTIF